MVAKVMQRHWLISAGLVLAPTLGCPVPHDVRSPQEAKAAMRAPPGGATVVFVSEARDRNTSALVDENGRCLAFPGTVGWYAATFSPGRHEIHSLGQSHTARSFVVELAAESTYFVEAKSEKPDAQGKYPPFSIESVKPGSPAWEQLDARLARLTPFRSDQEGCPKYLANIHPNMNGLIAATRAGLANAPLTVMPADGVAWKGSASASSGAARGTEAGNDGLRRQ